MRTAEAERAQAYRERNRALVNARARERHRAKYHDDPAHRAMRIARAQAWREANADRNREYQAAWARRREVRERTRAKRRAYDQAKRARKRAAYVEHVDPDVVLVRDCGICGICGLAVGPDWHLDHVVALARGGEHSYANVQAAHSTCNIRKGARA